MINDNHVKNRTIYCHDNLEVLKGINSESVDLIYLDPPFNKRKEFTAPIGSSAEGASFKDTFREEDVKDEWLKDLDEDYSPIHDFLMNIKGLSNLIDGRKTTHYLYNYCYLAYMARRLVEMQRILKPTGSLYLHCDPTMSHYLKILLDIIFGERNFRNEIVWFYPDTPGRSHRYFPRKTDHLFFYSKGHNYTFNDGFVRIPIKPESAERYKYKRVLGGKEYVGGTAIDKGKVPENVWRIPSIKQNSEEGVGYPTQKPLALLERIIHASCPEGGIVLDPFCGCATTCVAAEKLGRKWIGIDVSVKTYELVKVRLAKEVKGEEDPLLNWEKAIHYTTTAPNRTDLGLGYRLEKYVYVISNGAFPGRYKVGIASDVHARLGQYQTSDPDRGYRLEYEVRTPDFRRIEARVHEQFPYKHEWVQGDLGDIKTFVKQMHEEANPTR